MNPHRSEKFLDIPESALLSRPLTGTVVGADGIWDDFCTLPTYQQTDSNLYSKTLPPGTIKINALPEASEVISNFPDHFESANGLEIPVRNRNILTSQDARDIFMCLLAGIDDRPGASVFVSQQYGVSPKTVRDIWNRCGLC